MINNNLSYIDIKISYIIEFKNHFIKTIFKKNSYIIQNMKFGQKILIMCSSLY